MCEMTIHAIITCRQTIFLPVVGLVDSDTLKPGDLVGVNKDSYLILDTLPAEYDSRVKAMEVDEKPTEDYSDIGERACRALQSREVMVHRHQRKVAYPCMTPLENADGLAHRGRLALGSCHGQTPHRGVCNGQPSMLAGVGWPLGLIYLIAPCKGDASRCIGILPEISQSLIRLPCHRIEAQCRTTGHM